MKKCVIIFVFLFCAFVSIQAQEKPLSINITATGLPAGDVPVFVGKLDYKTFFVFYGKKEEMRCADGRGNIKLAVGKIDSLQKIKISEHLFIKDGTQLYFTEIGMFKFPGISADQTRRLICEYVPIDFSEDESLLLLPYFETNF